MQYDVTDRVRSAWAYFDKLLEERIGQIEAASGVSREHFVKINPMEFCEKNPLQEIRGYKYQQIREWITKTKTDDNFLISPLDDVTLTANQISYKTNEKIIKTIRASKCEIVPVPKQAALDFYIRNHRQTAPAFKRSAICFGLEHKGELVAVMQYDRSNGGVRGAKKEYELVRLSIRHGYKIHGAASKLQKACEETLKALGETEIYSYSNATINTGAVYKQLGFTDLGASEGQPHVLRGDNSLIRLLNLYPHTTNKALAVRGHIKCYLGGNRTWVKKI